MPYICRFLVTLVLLGFGVALPALGLSIDDVMPHLKPTTGTPMTMINLSRDHQLSYKAYNEYSDLNGDKVPETTYLHSYNYYGYFDSQRCYVYDAVANQFNPNGLVDAKRYCSGKWNGNFLNWATMTRMDVVRKILYGGYRSKDTSTETVLERQFLPTDAHSFAKYYKGDDIKRLTPFDKTDITLCNTTISSGGEANKLSHTNTDPPLIRVAGGDFSLWNSNERWQCYWAEEKKEGNGNTFAASGLYASGSNPSKGSNGLGSGVATGAFVVRVKVCSDSDSDMTADELGRCRKYSKGSRKPIGLLHTYGESAQSEFGMMTGSYSKNISGGVLRRNITSFGSEVNFDTDGTFTNVKGIVYNVNRIRQYGYNYEDGRYTDYDNCTYQRIGIGTGGTYSVPEGACSSWGNPIGTMFLESLRYFSGASKATSAFLPDDGSKDETLGLKVESFTDPFKKGTEAVYGAAACRPINVINFNASVNSYDTDNTKWAGFAELNGKPNVNELTDKIGVMEKLNVGDWFVGNNGTDNNNLCTAKSISNLSSVKGICPEAPTYYGGFKLAGAAYYAHVNPIRNDITIPKGNKTAFRVNSYSVALATGSPKIEVNVNGKRVTIQPSYRLDLGGVNVGAGTLVDFRIVTQTPTYGKYIVQWEDSEQGGDYDQDVWGTIEYQVAGDTVKVITNTIGWLSENGQGMGYVISGTDADGPHYHSGVYDFVYDDKKPPKTFSGEHLNTSGGCAKCKGSEGPSYAVYTAIGTSGGTLQDPLFYASKYGNFKVPADYTVGTPLTPDQWDISKTNGTSGADGIPDAYFYAIDPAELERSLKKVFANLIPSGGVAPTVTGSLLQVNSKIFLTKYSSEKGTYASGELTAFEIDSLGNQKTDPLWTAAANLTARTPESRAIMTNFSGVGTPFRWGKKNLSPEQMAALDINSFTSVVDKKGDLRLAYLRGDRSEEASGLFRMRNSLLGDLINSAPWYVGAPSAAYPDQLFAGYHKFFTDNKKRSPMVYVGSNDGMLHGFNALTGSETLGFVPAAVYSNLSQLTSPSYKMRPFVDGNLFSADAQVGEEWKTFLIGSTGRGAQSLFALDVTSPDAFSEENAKSIFKWEFSDKDDADLGHVIGSPMVVSQTSQSKQIVKMKNGKWAFVIGNGYGSENSADFSGAVDTKVGTGGANLFIIFLDGPPKTGWTPTTSSTVGSYVKVSLYDAACGTTVLLTDDKCKGAGPNNGLGIPTAADLDNDGFVDVIYASDLKGNVWKINVDSESPSTWLASYSRLYSATTTVTVPPTKDDPSPSFKTVLQPITTAPTVAAHPFGGVVVNFVTGRSLSIADLKDTTQQTMYGIWDALPLEKTKSPVSESALQQQGMGTTSATIKNVKTEVAVEVRSGSSAKIDWNKKSGWFYNLPYSGESSASKTYGGEKGISNPYLNDSGKLIFDTLVTKSGSEACGADPAIIINVLDPVSGSVPEKTFDSDGNGTIDAKDHEGLTAKGKDGVILSPSGIIIEGGVSGSTRISTRFSKLSLDKLKNQTDKATADTGIDNSANTGRIYWREITRNGSN